MLKNILAFVKRIVRKQGGFTLIELAVVLAVVGILAGVGVMKYIDVTAGAKKTNATARLADIKSCISMAVAKKGGNATNNDVMNMISLGYPNAATGSGTVTFADVVDANNAVVTFTLLNGLTAIADNTTTITNATMSATAVW